MLTPSSLIPVKIFKHQGRQLFLSLEEAPPHVQAYVIEQDTALLLEAPRLITLPSSESLETIEQLLMKTLTAPLAQPGSVIIKPGPPLQLLAIIHELEAEPTWQMVWIKNALLEILQIAEFYQIATIAMPLLGSVYGKLAPEQFFQLLQEALLTTTTVSLKQIWLLLEADRVSREEFEELSIKLGRWLW